MFDENVHATQGYVKAMNLGIHSVVDGTAVISTAANADANGSDSDSEEGKITERNRDGKNSRNSHTDVDSGRGDVSAGVSRGERMARSEQRQSDNIAMIKYRLRAASYHLGRMDFARLFRYYDRDNSGVIDKDEFISLMRRDGKIPPKKMSNAILEKLFDTKLDTDGGGSPTRSSLRGSWERSSEVQNP